MRVAGTGISETREGIATMPAPAGQTQTGREVQCNGTVMQTFHPMPITLHTPRQTITDHMVTLTNAPLPDWKIPLTEKSRRFELQKCDHKPVIDELAEAVQDSLRKLEEIWWTPEKGPISFCTTVTREIEQLRVKYGINDVKSEEYKFMVYQFGPYYTASLRPALEAIKSQAENECGWEYHIDIRFIGKYLDLQTDEIIDAGSNLELLKELYLKLVSSELDYLEFMKDCPVDNAGGYSSIIIERLLAKKYGAPAYQFISKEEMQQINDRKDELIHNIRWNLAKYGANNDMSKTKEDLRRGIADKKIRMQTKRRYNDLLKEVFDKEKARYCQQGNETAAACLSFLKNLFNLFVECTSEISELHSLPCDIAKEMTCVIQAQLDSHLYRSVRLEEEILDFIEDMLDKKVVDEEYGKPCLYCRELEFPTPAVMRRDLQTDEITDRQFENSLAEINFIFIPGDKAEAEISANKLRQLFCEYGDKIKALDTKDPDAGHIIRIRNKLNKELFRPLIQAFYEHQNQVGTEREGFADAKYLFHSRLVALSPYTFILTSENERAGLADAACAAWYCDIEELSQAVSFKDEDVDCLLELKHVSPYIPDQPLRPVLEKALENVFQFVLHDTGGKIPVEKIAILSQWVDGLNRVKKVDDQLKACNEKWKEINEGAVSKRNPVSSDILSISVLVPDLDQEASESVVLKDQPATARVVSSQSVPEAALGQPVSEDPPSLEKSESLLVPAERASIAKASKTDVVSSESQIGVEKDKSSGTTEQPDPVITGMAMITAPASQEVAASSLQGDDQLPFKADRHESRSTDTVPVEMAAASGRVENRKADMEATDPGVWGEWINWYDEGNQGAPRGMTTSPNTRTEGRHGAAVIRTYSRRVNASRALCNMVTDEYKYTLAVENAPETPWKTITTEESSTEKPDTEESSAFEITECKYQPGDEFRSEVENSLKTLERERETSGVDAWSFCLAVVKEIKRLENKYDLKDTDTDHYKFMRFQLGPYYVKSLRPALETLTGKAENDCSWECYRDIDTVKQYLHLQPNVLFDKDLIRELLEDVYERLLYSELRYMEFMKDFPFRHTATHSSMLIRMLLLSANRDYSNLPFITPNKEAEINRKKDRLIKIIESNLAKVDLDIKIAELEEEMSRGDAGPLVKRRYSDLLREKFLELRFDECQKRDVSTQEQLSMLRKFLELRAMHIDAISDFHSLPCEIAMAITETVRKRMIESLESGVRLEQEMLDFIDDMLNRDVVSKECEQLCSRCKELEFPPQARMAMTAQTDKTTDDQCRK